MTMDRRLSTVGWINSAFKADKAHSKVLNRMTSDTYLSNTTRTTLVDTIRENNPTPVAEKRFPDIGNHNNEVSEDDPINILVFDGGGAKGKCSLNIEDRRYDMNKCNKLIEILCLFFLYLSLHIMLGYASIAVIEEIERMTKELGHTDFASRFDLIAGTSAGGLAALVANQTGSTNDAAIQSREFSDQCTEKCFKNISFLSFILGGNAVSSKQQIGAIAREFFGEERRLQNEDGIKAFALSSAQDDADKTGDLSPFLLRTYEAPTNPDALEGTSRLKLSTALHATMGIPGLSDRIRIRHKGKQISLADGALVCNCPLVLAIIEAQHLWPKRPLGVILSVGLDSTQDKFSYRAFDVARVTHPTCHLYRIVPEEALKGHSSIESDMKKIAHLEMKVTQYLQTSYREKLLMKHTLKLLFQSGSRRRTTRSSGTIATKSSEVTKSIIVSARYKRLEATRHIVLAKSKKGAPAKLDEDATLEELHTGFGISKCQGFLSVRQSGTYLNQIVDFDIDDDSLNC